MRARWWHEKTVLRRLQGLRRTTSLLRTCREGGIPGGKRRGTLRRWDHRKVDAIPLAVNEERRTEWQWTLGEVGQDVQWDLQKLGWRNSLDAYRRSLSRSPA